MGTEPRLRIMQLLLSAHPEGLVVGEIQEELDIPNSTLSHHLDKLRAEDLVRVQRESTFLRYTANTDALQELLQFLYAECCTRNKALKPEEIVQICGLGDEMSETDIKEVVKEKYGQAALRVTHGGSSCCGATASTGCCDPITSNLYDASQAQANSRRGFAGVARMRESDCVGAVECRAKWFSISGSGGGIDVLLSAKRVGPTGKAYGLDMTDEMLALANENKRKAGDRERRVPEGRDRAHPAARQLGGCDHFQLRDQPFGGQRPGAAGGVPRAEAGRPVRGFRCGDARRNAAGDPAERAAVGGLRGGGARGERISQQTRRGGIRADRDRADEDLSRIEDAREFLSRPKHRRGCDCAAGGRQVHERVRSGRETRRRGAKPCCGPTCCN